MNIQNLMNQLQNVTNPMSFLTNMLNPSQKQAVNSFSSKSQQEQAEAIASKCNELGLSKDDFTKIVSLLGKK